MKTKTEHRESWLGTELTLSKLSAKFRTIIPAMFPGLLGIFRGVLKCLFLYFIISHGTLFGKTALHS